MGMGTPEYDPSVSTIKNACGARAHLGAHGLQPVVKKLRMSFTVLFLFFKNRFSFISGVFYLFLAQLLAIGRNF